MVLSTPTNLEETNLDADLSQMTSSEIRNLRATALIPDVSRMTLSESPNLEITGIKGEDLKMAPRTFHKFLLLPRELRFQIYNYLFASTRLTFGKKLVSCSERRAMKPAPNSLAILRTCRQINLEARAFWLGRVLFNFECVESLLDKLSAQPSSIVGQIRHLRINGARPLVGFASGSHLVAQTVARVEAGHPYPFGISLRHGGLPKPRFGD